MLNTYSLHWGPTGQSLGEVNAKDASAARRKAPAQYRKFRGEIGVTLIRSDVRAYRSTRKGETMVSIRHLTADEGFFFIHAGYSYNANIQTPAAGRTECATALAVAESLFMEACKVADVGITWEPDDDSSADGDSTPDVREQAYIWHRKESGDVEYLSSLGSIHDADANYRRVIRAEMATECADQLQAIIDAAKGE